MNSTVQIPVRERFRMPFRERGAAFVCAVAIEVLIALLFLFALMPALSPKKDKPDPPMTSFDVGDDRPAPPATKADARARPRGEEAQKARAATPAQPVDVSEPVVPDPPVSANVIWLSRQDYAASDVGKSRPRAAEPEKVASEPERRVAGDTPVAEGKGPQGQTMYEAEWQRRPTDAEIDPFIPARARGRGPGWGRIGCRTAPGNRVVDCYEIAEFPRGSGLAGAARQMSFQFKMKPTRINGRAVTGEWIQITFHYRETRVER